MAHELAHLETKPGSGSKRYQDQQWAWFRKRWGWCFNGNVLLKGKVQQAVRDGHGRRIYAIMKRIEAAVWMSPWVERKIGSKTEPLRWAAQLTVDGLLDLVSVRSLRDENEELVEEVTRLRTQSEHVPRLFWRVGIAGDKDATRVVCHQHVAEVMSGGRELGDYRTRLIQPVNRSHKKCCVCGRSAPKTRDKVPADEPRDGVSEDRGDASDCAPGLERDGDGAES